jgi:hypothetical protein
MRRAMFDPMRPSPIIPSVAVAVIRAPRYSPATNGGLESLPAQGPRLRRADRERAPRREQWSGISAAESFCGDCNAPSRIIRRRT